MNSHCLSLRQRAMAAHHQKRRQANLQRPQQRSAMDESTIASGSVVFAACEVDEKEASHGDDPQREAGCGGHLDCGDDDGGSLARSLLVSCRTKRPTATQRATPTQEQWDEATSSPTTPSNRCVQPSVLLCATDFLVCSQFQRQATLWSSGAAEKSAEDSRHAASEQD
jgi:hypothetical protein